MTMASEVMPRYRAAWLALAWLLLFGVVIGSLAPSVPKAAAEVSDKFMHFAAYAALAFMFMGVFGRRSWPRVAAGLLLLGGGIELTQAFLTPTRSGEWLDMASNATGIAAGILVAAPFPGSWCRQVERMLGLHAEAG